jgi:hypothetical protein
MLALSVNATAGAQEVKAPAAQLVATVPSHADSAKTPATGTDSTAKAAAVALPKWFDELAVNAFVSTAYEYNGNRPTTGANSYRVFDFSDNSFNLDVAELVVQIAASKPNDAGFRVDFDAGNSIPQITKTQDQTAAQFDLKQAFGSAIRCWKVRHAPGLRGNRGIRRLQRQLQPVDSLRLRDSIHAHWRQGELRLLEQSGRNGRSREWVGSPARQ